LSSNATSFVAREREGEKDREGERGRRVERGREGEGERGRYTRIYLNRF